MPIRLDRPYSIPQMRSIGRSDDTERLYQLEEKRDKAIRAAAEELLKVLLQFGAVGADARYFQDALPEALFNTLEAHDSQASLLAALAFVEWYRINKAEVYSRAKLRFDEQYRLGGQNYDHDATPDGV